MPPLASPRRQGEGAGPTSLPFRLPRAIAYIFPLILVVLYVSAVTTPPNKHTELILREDNSGVPAAFSLVDEGDVQQWDGKRDWELGSITVQRERTAEAVQTQSSSSSDEHPSRFRQFAVVVEAGIARIGDFVALLLGLEDDDDIAGQQDGSGLAAWSESSIYVELTHSLYASRPSSFGPHILLEPLESALYPITAFAPSTSHGCESPENTTDKVFPKPPRQGWIALVQRGHCPFSQKVRYAQERGAAAVVFGDQSPEEGGISGVGGLLTPWSPDDTSDVRIPSTFVSRASYLSLLQSWSDEQPPASSADPVGLLVIMSKDELFAWPLLDLLLLILFLPSLLTLLTVFTQRLRIIRQQQLDRAPRDAVAKLPVFLWGDTEKATDGNAAVEDEERSVGSQPTETTALLAPALGEERRSRWSPRVPGWARRVVGLQTGKGNDVRLAPRRGGRRYDSSSECPICLCEFEKGERVMELPCGHLFHEAEITPWLLDSKRHCPTCRASITQDDSDPPSTPAPAAAPLPASLPLPLPSTTSTTTSVPSTASSAPAALPTPAPRALERARQRDPSPVASSSSVTLEG
ncbi:hypothetical protein BCR35DRAFT_301274 [Leucosporidium creatinivorum]|uniref:RING-type domain-containing protein n=1 Tax=Leucosporidium creatinivorum TaxID=106004 RepID=A0A1Y2FX27_9BASI|nr:hypothetical protein BCR35DRAFT_301274 [Leucosporidium creatinivorum]